MSLPISVVQQFSPIINFHQYEQYLPCTIEYMMENGTIRSRPIQIEDQETSIPAVAVFNNKLWMVYTGPHDSQLYVSCSSDGLTWDNARQIDGQSTSVPAIAVLNGKLWMTYTDSQGSQLYVTCSSDGWTWEHARKIEGQSTSIPALAAFKDKLWMTYTDSNGSQLYVTCSSDGWTWEHAREIEGQSTSIPAIAPLNDKLWMIYTGSHDSQLYVTCSSDGWGWEDARKIEGQFTSVPAVATFGDRLYIMYSDSHSSQLWVSRSLVKDGWNWRLDIPNPTQALLAEHCEIDCYLDINPSQYAGQGLNAPQYYAVQEFGDYTEITYLILCAYNGEQTINALRVGSEFYCIVDDFARHPGDLERVTVKLVPNGASYTVSEVCFETHGDSTHYGPADLAFSGEHVVVHSSLDAHGTFNQKITGNWISKKSIAGVADFGDALSSDAVQVWIPSEYRLIGLDASGNPINGEVWAKFGGRLGGNVDNSFTGARYFNGDGLNAMDWAFVSIDATLAQCLNLIGDGTHGSGPKGPASRPYIRPAAT